MEYYLMHHGILGMRWGIRRYQNEDGSLTPEGEKRYLTNKGFRRKINSQNVEEKWKHDESLYDENGYLTDKGAKLYNKNKKFRRMIDVKRQKEEKERRTITSEQLASMSNQEVAELALRLNNEIRIKENLDKLVRTVPKTPSEKVKEFVKTVAVDTAMKTVNGVVGRMQQELGKSITSALFDRKDDTQQSNNNNKQDQKKKKETRAEKKERLEREKQAKSQMAYAKARQDEADAREQAEHEARMRILNAQAKSYENQNRRSSFGGNGRSGSGSGYGNSDSSQHYNNSNSNNTYNFNFFGGNKSGSSGSNTSYSSASTSKTAETGKKIFDSFVKAATPSSTTKYAFNPEVVDSPKQKSSVSGYFPKESVVYATATEVRQSPSTSIGQNYVAGYLGTTALTRR